MRKSDNGARQLRAIREFIEEYNREVFPTKASLEWFLRRNYARLVQDQAVIVRRGRGGNLIDPEVFDRTVGSILREASLQLVPDSGAGEANDGP